MEEGVLVGAPDPEIVALEARLRAAQLQADVEELERLISDELLFSGALEITSLSPHSVPG